MNTTEYLLKRLEEAEKTEVFWNRLWRGTQQIIKRDPEINNEVYELFSKLQRELL